MAQNVQKQNYNECRIQIRLTDGKTMVEKFKATEQLFAVSSWVKLFEALLSICDLFKCVILRSDYGLSRIGQTQLVRSL